jgi:hypothetical protein
MNRREPSASGGEPAEDRLADAAPRPWSRRARDVAAVLWPSFLAACLATLLFFALVDPELMGDAMTPSVTVSRMTGYAIGFFFFWVIAMVSSAITIFLVRTSANGSNGRS